MLLTTLSATAFLLTAQGSAPLAPAETRAGVAPTGADTETVSLRAKANGDDYVLYVAVPRGYASSPDTRFPVVYLLDGDWYFQMTVSIQRVLGAMQALRPAIIVGIGYGGDDVRQQRARRFKDMTPTTVAARPGSGKADGFLATLREDVFPYIERRFRTNGERLLIGHSLGGLFAQIAMIRQPALFHGYGILSPSLWWDDGAVLKEEERFRKSGGNVSGRAFLAVGAEEHPETMVATFRKLTGVLQDPAYNGVKLSHQVLPGATHAGVIPSGISMALQWLVGPPAATAKPPQ